ncbi:MAG: PspA/IM30 family protein [Aeromicrobium sp.]
MGIWQRIVRLVRSMFTREESVDQLSTRLDDTYREQTRLLQQVRRGVADVATSRKRVEIQLATVRQQISQLDDQARQAVARGDDDSARVALTRKVALEKAEADLIDRHALLKAEEDKLAVSASKVEQGVEQFRLRRDTLTARHAAASARAEINSATTGIAAASSEVGQAMASAERETRRIEATADAVDELVADGVISTVGEDPRTAELRRFDAELGQAGLDPEGQAEIERQLQQISPSPGEVSDGTDQIQR